MGLIQKVRKKLAGTSFGLFRKSVNLELHHYRVAVDAAGLGLWHRYPNEGDDGLLWTSPGWNRMLGYPKDRQFTYREFKEMIPDEYREEQQRVTDDYLRGKTSDYECMFPIRDAHGGLVWVRSQGQLVGSEQDSSKEEFTGSHMRVSQVDRIKRELLRAVNALNTFVFIKDSKMKFVFVNEAVANAYGCTPADCIGRSDEELSKTEGQKKLAKEYEQRDRRILFGDGTYPLASSIVEDDEKFVTHDGKTLFLRTTKERIELEGHGKCLLGLSLDTTEWNYSRMTLQQVIDASDDAIYIKDLNGRFILANQKMAEIVGKDSPEKVVGKTHKELFHDFDPQHAELAAIDEEAIKNGKPKVENERWATDASGNKFFSYTVKMPVKDINGSIVGVLAVSRNLTRLKREQELLKDVYDTLPQSVFVKDKDGKFIDCNESFREWHRRALGKANPIDINDRTLWEGTQTSASDFLSVDQQVIESGAPSGRKRETHYFKNGDKKFIDTYKFPRFDENDEVIGILGFFSDATDTENEHRVEIFDEISRQFRHVLRSWIYVLQENSKFLVRDPDDHVAFAKFEKATEYLIHFTRLADGLGSMDPLTTLQLSKEVAVGELVDGSLGLIQDGRIRIAMPNDKIWVTASEFHLSLALVELVQNAMRYAEKEIHVSAELKDSDCLIHVRDDGPGVSDDIASEMYSLNRSEKGGEYFGIGLSFVKRVAEAHHGELSYRTVSDKGAKFTIRIPIRREL